MLTPRYEKTSLQGPVLYIPVVPVANLDEILTDLVGEVHSIDWVEQAAFVHMKTWYDTPLVECILCQLDQDLSHRLVHAAKFLILRKARNPLPRYTGLDNSVTRNYFAASIETMKSSASPPSCLIPKHIRFDDGDYKVVDYNVQNGHSPSPHEILQNGLPAGPSNKNIHQLAAEYNSWVSILLRRH